MSTIFSKICMFVTPAGFRGRQRLPSHFVCSVSRLAVIRAKRTLLLSLLLLPAQGVWAVDADNDGSDSVEEGYAGTSDSDPNERPYWWKTLLGDDARDYFGGSVSDAGDVNADGHPDLIAGARGDNENGRSSGLVRVFSGLDGSILYNFYGDIELDSLGSSVSGAGDVNGDGHDDLIAGAPRGGFGVYPGYARVFSGQDGSSLYTFSGDVNGDGNGINDSFGQSVSGAGDVNGDGYADLIVGIPKDDDAGTDSGSAVVFSGQDGSTLYTFDGVSAHDRFGHSVSGAGDVDGDGYADVIVGARMGLVFEDNYGPGSAQVFSGQDGSLLYHFEGDKGVDRFGHSVSGAGDVNGDGHADLVVGSPSASSKVGGGCCHDAGMVRVFSGQDGSILYTFYGEGISDQLGWAVSGAGDVNGDGYDDVIAGHYAARDPRVYSGKDGSILYTFYGDHAGDLFGRSVSGAGDVDGDGLADLFVAAREDDINGTNSGSARIYLTSDLVNDVDCDFQLNGVDNCPVDRNDDQLNTDGAADGGDVCDGDDDDDMICDENVDIASVCVAGPAMGDNCPKISNNNQLNSDADQFGDVCDNCISITNDYQWPSYLAPDCGEACETSSCAGVICVNR